VINLDKKLELLKKEIMSDSDNKKYTDEGIEPLFSAPSTAKICSGHSVFSYYV